MPLCWLYYLYLLIFISANRAGKRLNLVIAVLACFIIRGGKSVSDFEAFSV